MVASFTRFSRLLEIRLVAKYLIILNLEGTGKYGQQYRLSAHRMQLVSSDKSDAIVRNHSCMNWQSLVLEPLKTTYFEPNAFYRYLV